MSRRERQKRRTRHKGHPARMVALITITLAICGAGAGALAIVGWVVSVADSAPSLNSLRMRQANPPSEVFAANGTRLGYIHSDVLYVPVPQWRIPDTLRQATVAIEDRRFWHHGALDYQGIVRAAIKDVFGHRNLRQGASTLTMQLVDNLYLNGTRYAVHHNLKYKIIQAKLAQDLERQHDKTWILDNYLSHVDYGTVS